MTKLKLAEKVGSVPKSYYQIDITYEVTDWEGTIKDKLIFAKSDVDQYPTEFIDFVIHLIICGTTNYVKYHHKSMLTVDNDKHYTNECNASKCKLVDNNQHHIIPRFTYDHDCCAIIDDFVIYFIDENGDKYKIDLSIDNNDRQKYHKRMDKVKQYYAGKKGKKL